MTLWSLWSVVGAGLLVVAMLLVWYGAGRRRMWLYHGIAAGLAVAEVGLMDLFLIDQHLPTVTRCIQTSIPSPWLRAAVMVGLVLVTWWRLGWKVVVPSVLLVTIGHLFW